MFEKIFGKKNSIKRELVVEILIIFILVVVFSTIGFNIFVNKEVSKIIEVNIKDYNHLKELLPIIRRGLFIILLNTIVVSTAVINITSSKILKPLEKMINATKKVADGDFDIRLETNRKDETKELVNNFNYMVAQLGKTELLQKDFINNVSHEIKTPISSIQGFARLLEDNNLSEEERKEYIGIIIEESNRLLNLSSSTLKLAKIQNQDKITKKDKINITEQIRKVLALLETKWREKNLNINISTDDVYFYGDPDLLFQVWTNLVDNAIKFTNKEGKIDISVKKENDMIYVGIRDNGVGMNNDELDRIFTRFYQVDESHSQKGSGLGLPIVKRIVDLSNGKIKVESEKNKGTNISIMLPIEEMNHKIII